MRALLIISVSIISLNLSSQDFEKKVCDCISKNAEQINFDYFQTLDEIEEDLIANNIIQNSGDSRLRQIEYISNNGLIEEARSYENILFEQIGLRTVKYCINLHTYGSKINQPSSFFRLMKELEILNQNIQKPLDLKEIRKKTAKILLKYQTIGDDSKLWKLIQLEYLYLFSVTEELKGLENLIEKDTLNTVNIHMNSQAQIYFNDHQIEMTQICDSLKNPIEQGKGIHFTNERSTKYKLYLEIYNAIKDCIKNLREHKSRILYDKPFESLNQAQKSEIMRLIPMRIVETAPK